ncbi:unnamed protein product, partial [Ectocarpus fasciculatus]
MLSMIDGPCLTAPGSRKQPAVETPKLMFLSFFFLWPRDARCCLHRMHLSFLFQQICCGFVFHPSCRIQQCPPYLDLLLFSLCLDLKKHHLGRTISVGACRS